VAPVTMSADDHHERRYYDKDGRATITHGTIMRTAPIAFTWGNNTGTIANSRESTPSGEETTFRWRHEHPDNSIFKVEIR
jgi:hypothetical protein